MSYQYTVRVQFLALRLRQNLLSWIPAIWLECSHTRVERYEARAFGLALLTKLIGTVTKHNTLVITDGCFGPVVAHRC